MYFESLVERRHSGISLRPEVSLADKYTVSSGHAYMTGIQALVRLCINQRIRDVAAGLKTAGFVSGYRGSPLGPLDKEFWKAAEHLRKAHVRFQPAVNEELAATAVLGSQQLDMFPGARYDGVFALWYGKGPGVDRATDAFKHGNFAGSHHHGGVLVLAGDDHGAYSSSVAHQSDQLLMSCSIPVIHPAGVQEYLDLGILGWAMSRYSGLWIGMKAVADTVESSAVVDAGPHRVNIVLPGDFAMPAGGLNIRWPDTRFDQEARLVDHRLDAVRAFVRANRLNRVTLESPRARLGIIASGKSYLDVMKALSDLGITIEQAADIGLRIFKVGVPWPLEEQTLLAFARGLEEIIVVEEKRSFVEAQVKELLYPLRDTERPRITGKDMVPHEAGFDKYLLLSAKLDFSPAEVALLIASRISRFHSSARMQERVQFIKQRRCLSAAIEQKRTPYYCSGCPHNTSTKVPQGSHALAGVGCHWMATDITPESTRTYSQMGGEGINWMGIAPFSATPHIFANLGDGTYFHSGLLAIRQAMAAKINITYKLLYNDAVAMTGGQPVDGTLSIPIIVAQLRAEGVQRIEILSEDPRRLESLANTVPIHHRDRLDAIQRVLREVEGVSVLIYDQTCATEKLRRRKRGKYPDPALRTVINEAVCEGCGDCGEQSNCTAIVPVETELGRKRAINQTLCNKDFSCVKGFCPSFVTVEGGQLKRGAAKQIVMPSRALPEPALPVLDRPYRLLLTGIGGTGVLTASAILGMAAQLDGKGVLVLDMTGMSQKNGGVTSHVQIAPCQEAMTAARLTVGDADLLLAFDLLVAGSAESLSKLAPGRSAAIGNTARVMPGQFAKQPDMLLPLEQIQAVLEHDLGTDRTHWLDASALCQHLFGSTTPVNAFMLGYTYQKGLLPLTRASLERAIELNGVATESNLNAFTWGRHAAQDLASVTQAIEPKQVVMFQPRRLATLDDIMEDRIKRLTQYQDARYAQRYRALVERVRMTEQVRTPGRQALAMAVARSYFKLLAYKDEYEVARLYVESGFLGKIAAQFDGDYKIAFHLAPPLFAARDPDTGNPRKQRYGPWVIPAFRLLARMKTLRGSIWDVFAHTADRKTERRLIAEFESLAEEISRDLSPANHDSAVALVALAEKIRGYGHVKAKSIEVVAGEKETLLKEFRSARPVPMPTAA
ncbi:MAG: indolepyruvate ferredoxin oxidoreductase family protein [Burkholderiales bacterium]